MKNWLALLGASLALAGCASGGKLRIRIVPKATGNAAAAAQQASAIPVARQVYLLKGDSFWRVAARELGSGARYAELAEFNGLKPDALIRPGQMLKLPVGAGLMPAPTAKKTAAKAPEFQRRPNSSYALGEKLTFAVQYFTATAGYATLSISETTEESGRTCLHIVAEARTHPFFEAFFKVRDRIETFIDADALIPWRYEKHLREGGYSADAMYVYDQRNHKMLEPAKGKEVDILPETHDVMSCFYWFRTMDLTVGRSEYIRVAADDMKNYELKVDVLRREKASTLAGDFDCVLVQPHLKFEGIFQQKGDVFIWLTDDARRIPVKIRSKIAIGSININLQDADWVQPQ